MINYMKIIFCYYFKIGGSFGQILGDLQQERHLCRQYVNFVREIQNGD